ncbi:MAG: hypothetical protein P4L85_25110 [Paludisphaera borealis]|uniref:hypothetical protein n=1 Tax=Paludisphaera borealis TaxID=1387353 RepID=UPI00283D472F|nr:hypothetical protein [Paludisphaera borealis]MDR3622656.1 hypothetical protein [Paludisphaera borealis]
MGASGCKHAVAVVAECLQAVADGRNVSVASEDDPRWDELDSELVDDEDELGDWENEDEDEDEEFYPVPKPRRSRKTTARKAGAGEWDGKIETHIRARSQGELADLVWSLTRRFPEVYQEFRERIALQEGKADELVAEARREIRDVTSEPGWRNRWSDEGSIPDYSRIKHRFERLLELGHAEEVVALGREFIKLGLQQVGMSNDEDETGEAFGECLPVVFQAVMRSSLSTPERLLFAIDAELADDYDVIGDASDVVFDAPAKPEDWSAVADELASRLKPGPGRVGAGGVDFSRDYQRDSVTYWIAKALEDAGRNDELRSLYESEARTTKSYERLVDFLMEKEQYDEAERWAREGIAATSEKLPGIAASLASRLCELAKQREHWDEVAAHAAQKFFADHPGPTSFDDLVEAARKAGVEESVRAAALHFLETGVAPYRLVSPRRAPAKASRAKPAPKGRAKAAKPAAAPEPGPLDRVKIDPAWPLPVPDYLVPLLRRPNDSYYALTPLPHLDVLLLMVMRDKRPDEVLRWYDRMRADSKSASPSKQSRRK